MCIAILFYPGIGGDQWYHLGYEIGLEKGWLTTWLTSLRWATFPLAKLYMALRDTGQYILVITLSRILLVDIYWVHVFFVAVLWNIFAPLISFKIAEDITGDKRVSLISGLLTGVAPAFMHWGSVSVPNSVGFFFFFFSFYCFLKCTSKNGRGIFIVALAGVLVSFLSHFLTGFAALSLLGVYIGTREYRRAPSWFPASIGWIATSALTIPFSILMLKEVYPLASFFSLEKFFKLDIYQLVLADYASMSAPEFLTSCALLFLSIIGILRIKTKYGAQKVFMGLSLLVFVFQYRFLFYFIDPTPFGPTRLWAFRDLILTPYAAFTIVTLLGRNKKAPQLSKSGDKKRSVGKPLFNLFMRVRARASRVRVKKLLMLFLVVVALSSIVADGVVRYHGYLSNLIPGGRVTTAQLDAIKVIRKEYLDKGERYVAVSDHSTSIWAAGILGAFNPDEVLFIYEDDVFREVIERPLSAPSVLASAVESAELSYHRSYEVVYFVAVKTLIKFYTREDGQGIVDMLSNVLETFYVSSDGEITVFQMRFLLESETGVGPEVQVFKDGILSNVSTMYSFTTQDKVTYNLNLSGSTTYEITGWPFYWRFMSVEPTPANASVDANNWINFTGTPSETYNIDWVANEFNRERIIWRDDSFLYGWEFYYAYGGLLIGSFESDGTIATESVGGEPTYYTMFRREIPMIQNATLLTVHLRGGNNVEFMIQLFDADGVRVFLVSWTEPTLSFEEYAWVLPTNLTYRYIALVARTKDGFTASLFWDTIAFSK